MCSLADDLDGPPARRALFFGRYNKPDWHLRLRVAGESEWLRDAVEPEVRRRLVPLLASGSLERWTTNAYEPEIERYGGPAGLELAERIYDADTRACLERLRAEADGLTQRSRREWCLALTEHHLEFLGLTRQERIEFYRHSWSFETRLGRWHEDDLEAIERRYRALQSDLIELFLGPTRSDAERLWGGHRPAKIAREYLGALSSLLGELRDEVRAGRITAHPVDLAWGLTHMHCNRMQVEADAEAIIRYFMGRLHEDVDLVTPA